jgi:hypothetical protein
LDFVFIGWAIKAKIPTIPHQILEEHKVALGSKILFIYRCCGGDC